MNLISLIEYQCLDALKKAFPNSLINSVDIEVTPSTQVKFGHYQCNSAMKLTKRLNAKPRDIAIKIVEELSANGHESIAKAEVAGPGFINIHLCPKFISQFCEKMQQLNHFGVQSVDTKKVVIDFSSPNTAKEMHVGHLRSTIIGDSIAKLLEYLGHQVVRLNHIGDWGTSFGMLISYMKNEHSQQLFDPNLGLFELMTHYKNAKKKFDESAEFKKQSQQEVVALQKGDKESVKYWQRICEISRNGYQEIYDLLDVNIQERGESFYNPYLQGILDDLQAKKVIEISDGAKCLFLDGFVNREGNPLPFMLQKSDGGFNYATTDLAAIRHRIEDEGAERIIYVTDAGQTMHFAMLFAAAEKAGYLDKNIVRVDHVPFGLVLGGDGKKFKTRSGDTEKLIDLLTTAVIKAKELLIEKNQQRNAKLSEQELNQIAQALGINAVKYSDLSCNRLHDYTFSYDRMLRFEGNTAAFLMYSYVRVQGIKRKIRTEVKNEAISLEHPSEIDLGIHLCRFNEVLHSISDDLLVHRLCDYLYVLAEKFNAFFRDCRVEGAPEQNQRLALCLLVEKVLKQGQQILGLRIVDKM